MTSKRSIGTKSLDFWQLWKTEINAGTIGRGSYSWVCVENRSLYWNGRWRPWKSKNHQERPSPGFVIEMKRELCRWSKVAFSKILRNNSRMVDPTNLFSQMCDHQHMCGIWGKSGQVSSSEADFTILSRQVSSSPIVWLNVEVLTTSVEPHRSAALL